MESRVLITGETGIKNELHKNESSININEIEINRIVLFDKISYGNKGSFKCCIGYRHKGKAFPSLSNIKLPQLTGYAKHFNNGDKLINFLVADKELLKNTIKYGIRLKTYSKKNLIKNPCMIINILVPK